MTKQETAKKIAKIHRKYNREVVNRIKIDNETDEVIVAKRIGDLLKAYAISIGDWFMKEIEKEFSK